MTVTPVVSLATLPETAREVAEDVPPAGVHAPAPMAEGDLLPLGAGLHEGAGPAVVGGDDLSLHEGGPLPVALLLVVPLLVVLLLAAHPPAALGLVREEGSYLTNGVRCTRRSTNKNNFTVEKEPQVAAAEEEKQ